MSRPHIPPELLDHVVDFLHDSSDALKSCSLVSKSWITRTRKHLFATIRFYHAEDLESWNTVFANPSTSPACYTKTLIIGSPHVIAAAGTGEDCWLSGFSRVVHLTMNTLEAGSEQIAISLIPFHGFSPVLKSLRLHMPSDALAPSKIFNLIRSFPLLDDLSVEDDPAENGDYRDFDEQPATTQSSPAFTGSLELFSYIGMDLFASRLLSLPNGLHFRNLDLRWDRVADISTSTALVEGCCSTLESIKIDDGATFELPHSAQVNLDKATKLKDVTFICLLRPGWILRTLRTVTQNHRELEWITLSVLSGRGLSKCDNVKDVVGETACLEWLEFDRLLAQLHESHSIRLKVLHDVDGSRERRRMTVLLPEVMMRGVVDLVEEWG